MLHRDSNADIYKIDFYWSKRQADFEAMVLQKEQYDKSFGPKNYAFKPIYFESWEEAHAELKFSFP